MVEVIRKAGWNTEDGGLSREQGAADRAQQGSGRASEREANNHPQKPQNKSQGREDHQKVPAEREGWTEKEFLSAWLCLFRFCSGNAALLMLYSIGGAMV